MARTFIYSDNLSARVELTQDDEGAYVAACAGCNRHVLIRSDLLEESRERFHFEDAEQVAAIHVDQCTRCADPDCQVIPRHDAGRRCRKN